MNTISKSPFCYNSKRFFSRTGGRTVEEVHRTAAGWLRCSPELVSGISSSSIAVCSIKLGQSHLPCPAVGFWLPFQHVSACSCRTPQCCEWFSPGWLLPTNNQQSAVTASPVRRRTTHRHADHATCNQCCSQDLHSLFHSRLKSFLFCKSSLPQPFLFLLQDSL